MNERKLISMTAHVIRDLSKHQTQFKKIIRKRAEQGNGVPALKDFFEYFHYEKVLKKITGKSQVLEIMEVLKVNLKTEEERELAKQELELTLWKENRLDKKYSIKIIDLWNQFKESEFYQDFRNTQETLSNAVTKFITFKTGLNSVFEVEQQKDKDFFNLVVIEQILKLHRENL